ncbi:MAG: phytanoyl-CoA dioxygenase family protein [Planctomycetes bacterium]|nr:phytanoyl-CoA dioxygenase family protein [Planctomycetota bacterium]
MLTTEQIEMYRTQGYLVIEDALSPDSLSELRDVTDRIVASASGLTAHTEVLDLEPSHTPSQPRVRRIKKPHLVDSFYRELAADSQITHRLRSLIGANIRLRSGGKVNMKSPGYGAPVEWHQDWAFYPHTNDDVLAVGLMLDDASEENGPLLVLPGSHQGPIYDHHSEGVFCGAIDVSQTDLNLSDAVPLMGRAGSMTIHHARLVHGSRMNRSAQPRRILLYEYAAADAWPLAGIEPIDDLNEFNDRIVLGEPTCQPRVMSVPVRMPLPRAPHQGSLYENQRSLTNRYFAHDEP